MRSDSNQDKGRLTEFLAKTRELFPIPKNKQHHLQRGDRVMEWTLTETTQTAPLWAYVKGANFVQAISVREDKEMEQLTSGHQTTTTN